jgi:hypothetical protein
MAKTRLLVMGRAEAQRLDAGSGGAGFGVKVPSRVTLNPSKAVAAKINKCKND